MDFGKHKSRWDKVQPYCLPCANAIQQLHKKTPKGRVTQRRAKRKYLQTEKGYQMQRAAGHKYDYSEGGQLTRRLQQIEKTEQRIADRS